MSFLTKKIINFEPEVFGVDLSDFSVKVFQFEKNGKKEKIRSFASTDIAPGNIEDGKIINKEKVAAIIKETVKKARPKKIKSNKVICSLPESKAFLRIISIPRISEEEAREAIKWEMEASIPMPIDQVYFDWQFIDEEKEEEKKNVKKRDKKNDEQTSGEKAEKKEEIEEIKEKKIDPTKQRVLTVAVSKEVVDEIIEVLSMAGLDAYGLELESVATARSLMNENEKELKNSLIVDLGAQRTSFIIVVDGVPCFTSSIPFSSETINDAIVKSLNISKEEAEKVKVTKGIDSIDGSNPVFNSVQPLLENLVQEIEKTTDFYGDIIKDSAPIEKVILCGGGSNLKGLVDYLTKRIGKEVEIGNPWVNVNFGKNLPIISKEDSVRFSTVAGLALRGLKYED